MVLLFVFAKLEGHLCYFLVCGQLEFWIVVQITNALSSLDAIFPGLGTALAERLRDF